MGLLLLAIPLLTVALMSPDPLPAGPERNEEAEVADDQLPARAESKA